MMLILTIRTDKPDSEIGLYEDGKQIDYMAWPAHRQLAETIHLKIKHLLDGSKNTQNNLDGIVVFQGPGSFTGLRIGLSVANALASGLNVPIVAGRGDDDWLKQGLERLEAGENDKIALPYYGAPVRITEQKK